MVDVPMHHAANLVWEVLAFFVCTLNTPREPPPRLQLTSGADAAAANTQCLVSLTPNARPCPQFTSLTALAPGTG
jgi:hypothetical protein